MGCGGSKGAKDTAASAGEHAVAAERATAAKMTEAADKAAASAGAAKESMATAAVEVKERTVEMAEAAKARMTGKLSETEREAAEPSQDQEMAERSALAAKMASMESAPKGAKSPPHAVESGDVTTPRRAAQDPDSFVEENPDGIYLVYEDRDGGTFVSKFSKDRVPGALAFARPSEFMQVAAFKYKKPTPIQSRTQSGRTMYYQAWAQWIKEARTHEAQFVLLPSLEDKTPEEGFPPMRIYLLYGTKVEQVKRGMKNVPMKLKFADAVAIVPDSYMELDRFAKSGIEVDKTEFAAKARVPADKFFLEFK